MAAVRDAFVLVTWEQASLPPRGGQRTTDGMTPRRKTTTTPLPPDAPVHARAAASAPYIWAATGINRTVSAASRYGHTRDHPEQSPMRVHVPVQFVRVPSLLCQSDRRLLSLRLRSVSGKRTSSNACTAPQADSTAQWLVQRGERTE